jgi:hypothetical protein
VTKEASHYVRLFGGNKIGNLIFGLSLVSQRIGTCYRDVVENNQHYALKLPDEARLLPKHVGASILNKGVVQFSA